MGRIPDITSRVLQFGIVLPLLLLAACGDGGGPHWKTFVVGYGCCGPAYELGAGLPVYRLEPRGYWNYPDYRGTGPVSAPVNRSAGDRRA